MIDGLVVVDKPAGCTSHDVVARCRRIFGQRRVGHAGTLDPDATGVLLVGLGRGTRLLRFLAVGTKSYRGQVVLGTATSTLDDSGEVVGCWDMEGVTLDQARAAAAGLTGSLRQVPPMVSAVQVGGRRLHELARQGIEIERQARTVTVTRFELDELSGPADLPEGCGPVFDLRVDCSAGTYIRSLAADLGTALGGGAHLRRLRRSAVGPFSIDEAVPLDEVGPTHVLSPAAALRGMPAVTVGPDLEAAVAVGKVLDRATLALHGDGPWAVLGAGGKLLAVYVGHGGDRAKPAVVVVSPPAGDR